MPRSILCPHTSARSAQRKEELIDKTLAAVKDRLTKEINYWDHRAAQLKDQELAGRVNAKLNSGLARQRADDLTARLQKRLAELEQERKLSPLPPVVLGGALIVPIGLLRTAPGRPAARTADLCRRHRAFGAAGDGSRHGRRSDAWAIVPRDVSDQNLGYDIESAIPGTGRLAVPRGQGPGRRGPRPSPSPRTKSSRR